MMISRYAFLAVATAFVGSTLQAAATGTPIPGAGPAPAEATAAERLAVPVARPKPRRPSLGAIQPPARPETLGTGVVAEPARPIAAATAAPLEAQAAEPAAEEASPRRRRARSAIALPPERPDLRPTQSAGPVEASAALPQATAPQAVAPAPQPAQPSLFAALFGPKPAAVMPSDPAIDTGRSFLDSRIRHHARLNDVPEALVHRIVIRESKYNPRAVGRGGAMGLMQIKTATARAQGYEGGPSGLLDAETNLTYAVKYLAGAYRTAGGSFDLSVRYYAGGYYYAAKRQGLVKTARRGRDRDARMAEADAPQ